MGYNGMTLFSTLERSIAGDTVFEDPYAQTTAVQCGSFPSSPLNVFNITYHPGDKPDPISNFRSEWLIFDLQLIYPLSQITTMMFRSQVTPHYQHFAFGGGKESTDAPPSQWVRDLVLYLPQNHSNAYPQSYNMGTIALAYISLHPDAFHFAGGDIPFTVETAQFQAWSWIGNSTWAASPIELEQLNVTFYIWPILCSLSVHNVTAWVSTNSHSQLQRTNFNLTLGNSTTPLINAMGHWTNGTSWSYIVDLLFLEQAAVGLPTWLEGSLNQIRSLTSLEDWLSNFAAFYYAFLVQHWRITGSQWWSEATGSVVVTQQVLHGQLDMDVFYWVLGVICVIVMIIASALSICRIKTQQGPMISNGVMDMISLLRGSSLPGIIAGDNDEDLGRDGRRHRAERTIVMYKNSILDVPERLEDAHSLFDSEAHEMTGLQSSFLEIISPGPLKKISLAPTRPQVNSFPNPHTILTSGCLADGCFGIQL
ncbi:hypothetical protein BS47DRAFT_51780 [Hydnum rufescens UP504]|uniref:Uncharacterized protein n=1 Tax=Hydnum rufescens UP504 TaxID=1448309 RepID=A0A9P6ARN1_9AGAM|nr:hypothetical protein BS47DRAFT_51780 [Hydnum rufescens UP504]